MLHLKLQVSRKFKNMKIDIHIYIYNYNNIDRPKAFKIYK